MTRKTPSSLPCSADGVTWIEFFFVHERFRSLRTVIALLSAMEVLRATVLLCLFTRTTFSTSLTPGSSRDAALEAYPGWEADLQLAAGSRSVIVTSTLFLRHPGSAMFIVSLCVALVGFATALVRLSWFGVTALYQRRGTFTTAECGCDFFSRLKVGFLLQRQWIAARPSPTSPVVPRRRSAPHSRAALAAALGSVAMATLFLTTFRLAAVSVGGSSIDVAAPVDHAWLSGPLVLVLSMVFLLKPKRAGGRSADDGGSAASRWNGDGSTMHAYVAIPHLQCRLRPHTFAWDAMGTVSLWIVFAALRLPYISPVFNLGSAVVVATVTVATVTLTDYLMSWICHRCDVAFNRPKESEGQPPSLMWRWQLFALFQLIGFVGSAHSLWIAETMPEGNPRDVYTAVATVWVTVSNVVFRTNFLNNTMNVDSILSLLWMAGIVALGVATEWVRLVVLHRASVYEAAYSRMLGWTVGVFLSVALAPRLLL